MKAGRLFLEWKLKPWINTIPKTSGFKIKLWNIVKAGYKPTSSPGMKDVCKISWCALCLLPSPEPEGCKPPLFVLPVDLPASSTIYSGTLAALQWRTLVASQRAFKLSKGKLHSHARRKCPQSALDGHFGWRTSGGIQPTPWPPLQFRHETLFRLILCFFTLPLNTLLTICVSLLPGILLLHQTVDSNFINV